MAGLVVSIAAASCSGRARTDSGTEAGSGGALAGAGGSLNGGAGQGGTSGAPSSAGSAGSAGSTLAAGDGGASGAIDEDGGAGGMGGAADELEPIVGPHPYRALQIAVGRDHTCALLEDHRVKCWGRNSYGQLGYGDAVWRGLDPAQMGDALPFVDLGTDHTAKAIAAGRYTSCAILDDDSVKCWGYDLFFGIGNVGDEPGEMGDHLKPVPLGPGQTAKAVSIGYEDGCIVRNDDGFICDVNASPIWPRPATPGVHFAGVSVEYYGVVALYSDGTAWDVTPSSGAGAQVPADDRSGLRLIAGSRTSRCSYFNDQQLVCAGPVVESTVPASKLPSQLPELHAMALAEWGELCGILDHGRVHCWGPILGSSWTPVLADNSIEVPLAAPAKDVQSRAYNYTCALLRTGAVECWSWNREPNAPGIGWDDTGATELETVDLGIAPGQ